MVASSQQPQSEIIDLSAEEPAMTHGAPPRARVSMSPQPVTKLAANPPDQGRATRRSTRGSGGSNSTDIFDERYQKKVCDIFDHHLKPKGWRSCNGGELADWMFYPSLIGESSSSIAEIKNKGTRGVHYAYDWGELGMMIEKYGLDHAPRNLKDLPSELLSGERKSLAEIHALLFDADNIPVAATTSSVPNSGVENMNTDEIDTSNLVTSVQGINDSNKPKANDSKSAEYSSSGDSSQSVSNTPKAKNGSVASGNSKKRKVDNPGSVSKDRDNNKKKKPINTVADRSVSSSSGDDPGVSFRTAGTAKESDPMEIANALKHIQKVYNFLSKASTDAQKENEKLVVESERLTTVAADSEKEAEKLKAEHETLKDKKMEFEEKCKTLKAELETLKDEKMKLEDKYKSLQEGMKRCQDTKKRQKVQCDKLKGESAAKDDETRNLKKNIQALQKELEEQGKLVRSLQRRLVRDDATDHRQHDVGQVQKQSVSSEENGSNEDDKKLREAFLDTIIEGNVGWEDVAGMQEVQNIMKEAVIYPIRFPAMYTGNRKPFKRILLYGPSGTGKSYIAKVLAKEAGCTFFSIKASSIGSKWTGESEKNVKALFQLAGEYTRAIIFIDEIDSLCGKRDGSISDSDRKVLTEFLTQMDGVGGGQGNVLVLAATNMPWDLDDAILNRFQKQIYVSLPDEEARRNMFKIHVGDTPNALREEDFRQLARSTDGASARDIEGLVKEALNEQVGEASRAKYFCLVGDLYAPVCRCVHCPEIPSTSCMRCGAEKMVLDDIPDNKLKARNVVMSDFEGHLRSTYQTLADDDLQHYTNWAQKF